jgi:hypothetical protein
MKSTAELTCDCEKTTPFDYDRPLPGSPTKKRVTCQHCHSVFTFRFRRVLPSGDVSFTMEMTEASRKLEEHLARKRVEARLRAPQKKAPQIFM